MTTPDMQFTDLHGERIAYRDIGAGDALLLVHGMAGSSATWDAVIGPLSQRFRVIAPDLPGHGLSSKPRGDYSLGAFAAFLRDLLDRLGVERVTVVGQSLGWYQAGQGAGWLASIVGAVVLLFVVQKLRK